MWQLFLLAELIPFYSMLICLVQKYKIVKIYSERDSKVYCWYSVKFASMDNAAGYDSTKLRNFIMCPARTKISGKVKVFIWPYKLGSRISSLRIVYDGICSILIRSHLGLSLIVYKIFWFAHIKAAKFMYMVVAWINKSVKALGATNISCTHKGVGHAWEV